jgi:hypothetical protein
LALAGFLAFFLAVAVFLPLAARLPSGAELDAEGSSVDSILESFPTFEPKYALVPGFDAALAYAIFVWSPPNLVFGFGAV